MNRNEYKILSSLRECSDELLTALPFQLRVRVQKLQREGISGETERKAEAREYVRNRLMEI